MGTNVSMAAGHLPLIYRLVDRFRLLLDIDVFWDQESLSGPSRCRTRLASTEQDIDSESIHAQLAWLPPVSANRVHLLTQEAQA